MVSREPRVQFPALEAYSCAPLFNTKAVVRQTGVPAPTLRAWERRYGVLAPHRGGNDYRLYSERDMAIVGWLRARVEGGMTISQAIALLRSLEHGTPRSQAAPLYSQSGQLSPTSPSLSPAMTLSLRRLADTLLGQLRDVREQAAQHTIAQALAVHSVEDVCLGLLTPVLEEVGDLWDMGQVSIACEHFCSAVIRAQLEALFRSAAVLEHGPCLLVGCVPGELHEVGALMMALFLRRLGLHVIYLGQSVEAESVVRMAAATEAVGVVLSAALADHIEALAAVGRRLVEEGRPHTVLYFGGRAFAQRPALAEHIAGRFLSMGAFDAAREVQRRCLS